KWVAEFASVYRREIGIPFECYTHPQTMTRDMARWLAEAGCMMVRVGVQSVNSDTLAAVDRKGDREKVTQTLRFLVEHGVPYSVDHIIGLPGEGAADQLEERRYRHLRGVGLLRQLGALALAIRGEPATREHVRHILATTLDATREALRRKLVPRAVTQGS